MKIVVATALACAIISGCTQTSGGITQPRYANRVCKRKQPPSNFDEGYGCAKLGYEGFSPP